MNLNEICEKYAISPQIKALNKTLSETKFGKINIQGVQLAALPILFSALYKIRKQTTLFILNDNEQAAYFYNDLLTLLSEDNVCLFPSSFKRSIKYAQIDAGNQIQRTQTLIKLQSNKNLYIVTSPEAICEQVISSKKVENNNISLTVGQEIDMQILADKLLKQGFCQVDYVYQPGQFALRGSIIDVFSYSNELPFRIDFWGDEIETIRTFDILSQLSQDKKQKVILFPQPKKTEQEYVSLLNHLPKDTTIVTKDLQYIINSIEQMFLEGFAKQALQANMDNNKKIEHKEFLLIEGKKFQQQAEKFQIVEFYSQSNRTYPICIKFDIIAQPLFHKNFDLLKTTLKKYSNEGYRLYILSESVKQQERLKAIINPQEIDGNYENVQEFEIEKINFTPIDNTLHEGFIDKQAKICVFTDHQIFDRFHRYQLKTDCVKAGKSALTMKELQEMEVGDYVVHIDFGIGKFVGLIRIPTEHGYKEVIRITYQKGDIVDLSIHSLYKISKYKNANTTTPPKLSTLGTGAWERLKEKTKIKIKDIARDLIKLYAKRKAQKGFAYSKDTSLQNELEAAFLYEDTPDQLKTTQDVKADMQSSQPMDRLICGDVGFGKTEIAMRAAFKAAYDGKQTAILVPTTVLALQHYKTFYKRLKDFPVKVDFISRAKTAKKLTDTLQDLEEGKTDIIIGTHKLIGKNVKFKDLGLLIIDEEQKFGVAVKEKLRKLKTNVDTLTLSATPIPRTLQFSLMGARDLSIIQTPPPNRHPIITEINIFDAEIIADAINFEMSRNGQVFFVNARISQLQEIAELIKKYIPDCRVAIVHGQLSPATIENIMTDFVDYEYDVLLSTTIIESGIDIPNANTIIINNAHYFGLSDLHQMRGRVGRSNKKAFCYLLAPPLQFLTPDAARRLEVLETNSELGSGFNIAMQDLDIRGAGNLLGAEQSGFMEDLGYETYQKILIQAINELRDEEFQDVYENKKENKHEHIFVEDCVIESDLPMYFPDEYIPGSSERMLLYKELDKIKNTEELHTMKEHLMDRFGELPQPAEELLWVVPLRIVGKLLGFEKITIKNKHVIAQFVSTKNSKYYQSAAFDKVLNYIGHNPLQCSLKEINSKRLLNIKDIETIQQAVKILEHIYN